MVKWLNQATCAPVNGSVGRVFSFRQSPGVWGFSEDQSTEAFRPSVSMAETLLVTAHAPTCFWGLHLGNGRLGHTDHQAAKHPQDQRRIGVAHPAAVLIQ